MIKPVETPSPSAVRSDTALQNTTSPFAAHKADPLGAVRDILTPIMSAVLGSDALGKLFMDEFVRAAALTDADVIFAETPELGTKAAPMAAVKASKNTVINQGNYKAYRLGDATSNRTISQSGCVLASLTSAANQLTGSEHDPVSANAAIVQVGGFKGADMNLAAGARALGLTLRSRDRASPGVLADAEEALDRGAKLLVGVDYKAGDKSAVSAADHFLLVVGRDGDKLKAIDSAGGREITFEKGLDGRYTAGSHRTDSQGHAYAVTYTIAEVSVLTAAKTTPVLPAVPSRV